ncbi:cytochrome P450 [Allokutzneria sp. NRRL B-24872]|uniref:cytochrome P450 n=1 Tax=Allokutzneria sp. NRRL B-24872 TaxID=1137961 RepID=UPI001AEFD2C0|nr:cytochrome P450 [Allokutzneria sp. NRRL B-24872]
MSLSLELRRDANAADLLDWFAYMRANHPVYWDESRQAWQVFGYADFAHVASDPSIFSSDFREAFPLTPETEVLMGPGVFGGMDPPGHGPVRRLVSQAFTPKRIAALEPRIVEIAKDLLSGISGDSFDMVEHLAYPLPVIMIADLLGIPAADQDKFRDWVDNFLSNQAMEYPNLPEDFAETTGPVIQEMVAYFHEKAAEKRAVRTNDVFSDLVHAELDGRRLTDKEIVGIVALLLSAGHISSSTLIANIMLCLDEHPEAERELRADHSLIPAAIEEVLRYRSPFNNIFRILKQDTELHGHQMRKGQMVIAWMASANRDETVFPNPDVFDIHRERNRHFSFGHGIHHCLGSALARLEAKVLLPLLFERFPRFEVDHDGVEFYEPDELTAKHVPVKVRP